MLTKLAGANIQATKKMNSSRRSSEQSACTYQPTYSELEQVDVSENDQNYYDKLINLNVSGRKFECLLSQLVRLPDSTLGNSFYRDRYYDGGWFYTLIFSEIQ